MHGQMHSFIAAEYTGAAHLVDAMNRLRRAWMDIQPEPPVRRGDVMLLGFLMERERREEPPVTVGDLAKALHHSPPSITQKVNSLEENGLLKRTADKSDKRLACVELTDKGRKMAECCLRIFWGRIEAALEKLGKQEAEELVGLLNRLSDAVDDTAQPPGG